MKHHHSTSLRILALASLCLVALPAMALVGLKADQTYEFNASGAQTAYVCRYNFTDAELNWHGPYYGPTDFDITFTRTANDWIGLYTYNMNTGTYERVYYLYYTYSL